MTVLDVQNVLKKFGGVTAVNYCTLEVKKRLIKGLIGPNGAGKTTLMNLISGMYEPDDGKIFFENKCINGLKPHKIARMGAGRLFQTTRVFMGLTVMENLLAAVAWSPEKDRVVNERAVRLLGSFRLIDFKDELAKNLSGGQQRLLEIARVLMSDPKLLLLDEPFYGINPALKRYVVDYLRNMKDEGKAVLIVSHDLPSIMQVCDEIVVMSAGRIIASGSPEHVRKEKKVVEAYLGI